MIFEIHEPKIVNYLLRNPKKAGFFLRFGYSGQEWTRLRDDILEMTEKFPLNFERENEWGKKYAVRGHILAPNHRILELTTIWMVKLEDPTMANFRPHIRLDTSTGPCIKFRYGFLPSTKG